MLLLATVLFLFHQTISATKRGYYWTLYYFFGPKKNKYNQKMLLLAVVLFAGSLALQ